MGKTICFKENKKIKVFDKVIFIFIFAVSWILFALNTGNADYFNYETAYNLIASGGDDEYFEFFFRLIVKASVTIGLSYQMFLAVIATITLTLFVNAIKHFTNNKTWVYAFYILYPFVFDVVQYRNFISFTLCLYGLHFIFKDSVNLKQIIKFCAFTALGSLFHLSSVLYFFFLLILVKKTKHVLYIAVSIFSFVIVMLVIPNLFETVLQFFGLSKYIRYEIDYNLSTFIKYFTVYLAFLLLGVLNLQEKYDKKSLKLMLVIMIFVPFILFNGTSARFFRNAFVLFYAIILDKKEESISFKKVILMISLLVVVVFVGIMQFKSGLYHDTVLMPILTENLLFKG